MEIRDLLRQTDKLPNIPEVARQLITQLNNPAVDYGEIARKVSNDQTLSLKILRLVNSAHFGLSRKVASIDQAIVMLGMVRLKTLVIASGIAGSVKAIQGLDLKTFWRESFHVAVLAKWFAEHETNTKPDIAFTAGLIHNIGQLLFYLAQPIKAKEIQTLSGLSQKNLNDIERDNFGLTSPEAGQALLNMWKFPDELGEAVLQHKNPIHFDKPSQLAAIVNLASIVTIAARQNESIEALKEKVPKEIISLAGISTITTEMLKEALDLESGLDSLA